MLAKIFALYKGTVIVREADSLNGLPNLSISSLITKIAISIFYRLADVVIANSEHTAHSLVKLAKLPKKNIKIMHNFISSPIVKVSNKKLSTSKLISFSRLVKKKRVDEIIDAFTLILNKHPGINLEIYGEGDEKTKLEKIAIKANKSSKRIKILGSVEKIEKVVTPGTILIHNSEYEGFGLVMLEAAFSGAYVLAANVGSSEIEVVGRKKSIGELVDTAKKREDRIKILSSHLDQLCREGYRFDVDARIKHLSKFDETSAHNKISEIFS